MIDDKDSLPTRFPIAFRRWIREHYYSGKINSTYDIGWGQFSQMHHRFGSSIKNKINYNLSSFPQLQTDLVRKTPGRVLS